MKNEITIEVSPIFDPWYYEYYFKGLVDYYGKENVKFNFSESFMEYYKYSFTKYRKAFFYYEITSGETRKRVVISAEDWVDINSEVYKAVDCYAKVNVVEEQTGKYQKILPIGPNFGIRYFSLLEYIFFTYTLHRKTKIKNPFFKTFFTNSFKRSFYRTYERKNPEESNLKKTFYLNYPWRKHHEVTKRRKEITKILKDLEKRDIIIFEGGFSKRRFGYHKGLKPYSAKKNYSHKDYIKAVKRAGFVINTPAVHGCLGWKLGEYLALGKPIISLPLGRVMPGDFKEDVHYVEIENIQELYNKIPKLLGDPVKTQGLSHNAAEYFQQFLTPERVIHRIHRFVH